MRGYEVYPTNQAVPGGYERLVDVQGRIGKNHTLEKLQLGELKSFELNSHDGKLTLVSVEEWRIEYADTMLTTGFKHFYFSPEPSANPAEAREVFYYGQTWQLLLVELSGERLKPNDTKESRGGRPLKYDWAGLAAFMSAYVVEHDFPAQQSTLVREALSWFDRRGKAPEDNREVERWVAQIYQERDYMRRGQPKT